MAVVCLLRCEHKGQSLLTKYVEQSGTSKVDNTSNVQLIQRAPFDTTTVAAQMQSVSQQPLVQYLNILTLLCNNVHSMYTAA